HVVVGKRVIPRVLMDWQPLVKHDHRHEMGMGQYPQTGLGCCSSYRHVVVGKRVIPRVLMDWQPLVKHDHRHEMGMGQYPAPGVHCGSDNRTMVMGCCAIPGIHLDRKPLGHDPYRFFLSSRRRHTSSKRDWSSDVCSSDLASNFELEERFGKSALNVVSPLVEKGVLK